MINEQKKKELRQMRNEYARNWRRKNPEKVQAINEKFWERRLAEKQEQERNGKQ